MKSRVVILLILVMLVIFAGGVPCLVLGQTLDIRSHQKPATPGQVSGSGVVFTVSGSSYLNVTLTSSKEIKVVLQSVPKVISLSVESANQGDTFVDLQLQGLEANKNYYQYSDSYKNVAVFVSDGQGGHAWTQDLAVPHHIWFQEAPVVTQSASFENLAVPMVADNSEDLLDTTSPTDTTDLVSEDQTPEGPIIAYLPEECFDFGSLSSDNSTCTLSQDINEDVEIDQDNFVLDCDSHKITGGDSISINLYSKKNIEIKNCEISGDDFGVFIDSSEKISIENSSIAGQFGAICSFGSSGINLSGNIVPNSAYSSSIDFFSTDSNTLLGNNIVGAVGFYDSSANTITSNDISGSQSAGIYFSNSNNNIISKNNITGSLYAGVGFGNSSNNEFKNNIVSRGDSDGLSLYESSNNNIVGNTISSNRTGIDIFDSNNNILSNNGVEGNKDDGVDFFGSNNNKVNDNTISNDRNGIDIFDSNNNILSGNNIEDSEDRGIGSYNSSFLNFSDNNISHNGVGFSGYGSDNIKIYHNNFIDNLSQAETHDENVYFFDNSYPSGGNYWSDYIGIDIDGDNIGDSAYVFDGGQDNYPFMLKDAWVAPSKTPVLIIPGITGTEMKKGDEVLWPNFGKMLADPSDSFMGLLAFSKDLVPSDSEVAKGDVIRNPSNLFDYTDSLVKEFTGQGYVEGQTLFTFPYDWRYGVSGEYSDGSINSDLLKKKIEDILKQTKADKVDVVAHSMGGLVVKKYIKDNPSLRNIGKAVFVGVPETGAPSAIKGLLQGDNFGVSFGPLGLSDKEMKKVAENMPAAYDLLPTQMYYYNSGSFVSKIDFGRPGAEPQETDLDYQDFEKYLIVDKGLNGQALTESQLLHNDSFDNLDLRSYGIDLYAIDGCKTATMTNFLEESYKDLFGVSHTGIYDRVDLKTGDGTVPIQSSTNLPIDQDKKYYALSGPHSKLLSQDGTRQQIVNLISGSSLPVSSKIVTQDASQCQLNGKAVIVFSPIDISIVDGQGNKLGLVDGNTTNEIPNANFQVLGEHKFIYLPQDSSQTYTISMQGTGTGTYTIKSQNIVNGQITGTEVFSNLPVTPNLTGQININPGDPSAGSGQATLTVQQSPGSVPITIFPDDPVVVNPAPVPVAGGGGGGAILLLQIQNHPAKAIVSENPVQPPLAPQKFLPTIPPRIKIAMKGKSSLPSQPVKPVAKVKPPNMFLASMQNTGNWFSGLWSKILSAFRLR